MTLEDGTVIGNEVTNAHTYLSAGSPDIKIQGSGQQVYLKSDETGIATVTLRSNTVIDKDYTTIVEFIN